MSLTIMMTMSLMFIFSSHPISTGAILLIQTILISMSTSMMSQTPWFSYILFLIMIGGMMILFMYMTSIASNEKFTFKMNFLWIITILPFMMYTMNIYKSKSQEILTTEKTSLLIYSISKFMVNPAIQISMFLMFYLLLAMIASVKITNFKQGSIRQMN